TAWGKPFLVECPNGFYEKRTYTKDGILQISVNSYGIEIHYTHDYKGRKTSEEIISPKGEILASSKWIYNTFNLVKEIDPAGHETHYQYDGAGRVISIKKGVLETKCIYDSLGRKTETWELYEPGRYRKT